MTISFIGLGIMGSRMAANLLDNGIDLTVWNRSREPAQRLAEKGATVASALIEAVSDADLVITMLSKPEVVETLMFGEGKGLSQMKQGALWMDSSTVNPAFSRRSGEIASQFGIRFLDAPVAGSKPQAEAAQLAFFVGGTETDLEEARPLMEHMGQKVIHLGEIGMGSSFKMLVNALLAQSMVAFSEMIHLGTKMGLKEDFLLNTLSGLPVTAPFTKFKTEMMASGDYPVNFPLELMHKDLHLAAVSAYEVGQPMYLANLAKELYSTAVAQGLGRMDFSAIHEVLKGIRE